MHRFDQKQEDGSDEPSHEISKIHKRVEDFKMRSVSDPGNAAQVLNDSMWELQVSLSSQALSPALVTNIHQSCQYSYHNRTLYGGPTVRRIADMGIRYSDRQKNKHKRGP